MTFLSSHFRPRISSAEQRLVWQRAPQETSQPHEEPKLEAGQVEAIKIANEDVPRLAKSVQSQQIRRTEAATAVEMNHLRLRADHQQRRYDLVRSGKDQKWASPSIVEKHVHLENEEMHKLGLHMGYTNGVGQLSSPEAHKRPDVPGAEARDKEINSLASRINALNSQIRDARNRRGAGGVDYGRMNQSRFRSYNKAPNQTAYMMGTAMDEVTGNQEGMLGLQREKRQLEFRLSKLRAEKRAGLPYNEAPYDPGEEPDFEPTPTPESALPQPRGPRFTPPQRPQARWDLREPVGGAGMPVGFGRMRGTEMPQPGPEQRQPTAQEALEQTNPKLAGEIKDLPPNLQEPVARLANGIDPKDQPSLETLTAKMKANPNIALHAPLMMTDGKLRTPEAIRKEPTKPEEKADKESAAKFVESLTAQEKALLERTVEVANAVQREKLPGTQGQESYPLDAEQNPAVKRNVEELLKRHNNAKTVEDRNIAEGLLRMKGVDVDGSDLKSGKVNMLPTNGRLLGVIMGLFQVISGIFEKLGGKKTSTEKAGSKATEAKPDKKGEKPDEKAQKLAKAKEEAGKQKQDRKNLEDRIKKLEENSGKVTKDAEQAKLKVDSELEQARKDLKTLKEQEDKTAQEIKMLQTPSKAEENPKKEPQKAPETQSSLRTPTQIKQRLEALLSTEKPLNPLTKNAIGVEQIGTDRVKVTMDMNLLKNAGATPEARHMQRIVDNPSLFGQVDRQRNIASTNPMDAAQLENFQRQLLAEMRHA
jgi:hypothetical protein